MSHHGTDTQRASAGIRGRASWRSGVAVATIVVSVALLAPWAEAVGAEGATPTVVRSPAAKSPVNDALPNRWFGVIESLFIANEHGTKTTIKTYAKATFTRNQVHPGSPRFPGDYDYLASGTLTASYSMVGGECTWKGSDTIRLQPSNGGLRFNVWKPAGKRVQIHYSWLSGSAAGGHDPTIKVALNCPDYSATVPESITWIGLRNHNRTTAGARVLRGTWSYPAPSEGFRTWCLTRTAKALESCKADELQAVARVSGSTQRAATRTLDGSRSKGELKSYRWMFDPVSCASTRSGACAGYCKEVGPRPGAHKSGARVRIRPLCTIRATLTVSDGEDEDSDSVLVRVMPRSWRTPVAYRETREPMMLPRVRCDAGTGECKLYLTGGANDPDPAACPGRTKPGSQLLCPLLGGSSTWSGTGYKFATLSDPDGPFDGYSYIASSTLAVKMLGVLNRFLFPESVTEIDDNNFYTYNKKQGANVDGFLKALSQHEGWGAPGKPHTGHAQAVREALAKAENDPRREIEQLIAPSALPLQQSADNRIRELDTLLNSNTCDVGPGCGRLNEIGKFDLYFFNPTPTSFSWDRATVTVT